MISDPFMDNTHAGIVGLLSLLVVRGRGEGGGGDREIVGLHVTADCMLQITILHSAHCLSGYVN